LPGLKTTPKLRRTSEMAAATTIRQAVNDFII
jgi:hypothetical protein